MKQVRKICCLQEGGFFAKNSRGKSRFCCAGGTRKPHAKARSSNSVIARSKATKQSCHITLLCVMGCFATLAMTDGNAGKNLTQGAKQQFCHCEEQSDEAILSLRVLRSRTKQSSRLCVMDCFATLAMTGGNAGLCPACVVVPASLYLFELFAADGNAGKPHAKAQFCHCEFCVAGRSNLVGFVLWIASLRSQ